MTTPRTQPISMGAQVPPPSPPPPPAYRSMQLDPLVAKTIDMLCQHPVPNICDCCVGTGKPESGLPCICGGKGTLIAMIDGLRKHILELETQVTLADSLLKALNEKS